MSRRVCACIAAIAVFAALGAFASAAEALPTGFWGVVPQAVPSEEQFQRLARGGVESVRIPVDWGAVQPQRGVTDWAEIDAIVKHATAAGVEVLPFVTGAPAWAVPSVWVPGSNHSVKAPAHLPAAGSAASAWSSFLAQAVARYGSNGSFWAENPTLPEHPILNWQVWNEENFKYFVAKPNPAEYGKLVKLSYAAIKGADPRAKVVLGGMFARPMGSRNAAGKHKSLNWFASDFLAQMYRLAPGIKAKFNAVALHPYTSKYQLLTPEIEEFRAILKANHDAGKGLWITELGWSSQKLRPGENDVFAKGEAGQVTQLKGAFSLLERNQVKWKLQRLYWFSVDDQTGSCNFCDGTGLFAEGFVPKRSWFAYVKFAGGTP